jgi:hypothetical protein
MQNVGWNFSLIYWFVSVANKLISWNESISLGPRKSKFVNDYFWDRAAQISRSDPGNYSVDRCLCREYESRILETTLKFTKLSSTII